jgi:hypothetical protein
VDINSVLKNIKVIGIASIIPREGKSTVARNFAELIAILVGALFSQNCLLGTLRAACWKFWDENRSCGRSHIWTWAWQYYYGGNHNKYYSQYG